MMLCTLYGLTILGAWRIIEGSDSLEDLKGLAEQGVEIYACGACLNFYELTAAVGEVTNIKFKQAPQA
jgi:intracellular sulfur oxidation DsrE/DsrF family protein